jgi:hypothetical protein
LNWATHDTGVVITMAGAGSRFAEVGYTVPKYEIEVHGRTLFAWSMESLRSFIASGSPFTFVARDHPDVESFIAAQCDALGIRQYRTVMLDAITDGQATTAMLARDVWDDMSRPLAIYNIDTYVNPIAMPVTGIRGQGWLPCFPGEGDKWSFAAADTRGRVTQVREKNRISPHATVGLYWFDSFKRFAKAYHRYYSDAEHVEARERYIAPLYNQLMKENAEVYIHEIPAEHVYPLGTPEDVIRFAAGRRPEMRSSASGQ